MLHFLVDLGDFIDVDLYWFPTSSPISRQQYFFCFSICSTDHICHFTVEHLVVITLLIVDSAAALQVVELIRRQFDTAFRFSKEFLL